MNKDIFFATYIKDTEGQLKGGMAVRIPAEMDQLPGTRIKALTDAARGLPLKENERLRTEMLVAPPADVKTSDLSEYLWADGTVNGPRLVRHLENWRQGHEPHLFQPRCGVPVMGEELIGRDQLLGQLKDTLTSGHSCHLRAPRRYGKTSLLMRLSSDLPDAVLLEVSDIGNLRGFLKVLLRGCSRNENAWRGLQEMSQYHSWSTEASSQSAQLFNGEFAELMKAHDRTLIPLIAETLRTLADHGIILFIDEFSIFLRNMHDNNNEELYPFLTEFLKLRTRENYPLVTVFAGSAGLSTYIEFYDLRECFTDLVPMDVCPITTIEAKVLAEELFYGIKKIPSIAAIDKVVALTGGDDTTPYFVHDLANETAAEVGMKKEIDENDVERAYNDRLLGPPGNIFFRDFILRERAYPKEYRSCASNVLKILSRQFPERTAEDELKQLCKEEGCDFIKLMTCLEEDYDLVHEDNTWRMRSPVIADRWRLGEPWLTMGDK
jgi:hypothetical protein